MALGPMPYIDKRASRKKKIANYRIENMNFRRITAFAPQSIKPPLATGEGGKEPFGGTS